MTWSDPIVDEVRRVRDAYAARFNYDLRAIFRDLKEKEEQEKRKGRKFISFSAEGKKIEPLAPEGGVEPTPPSSGSVPAVSGHMPSQSAGSASA